MSSFASFLHQHIAIVWVEGEGKMGEVRDSAPLPTPLRHFILTATPLPQVTRSPPRHGPLPHLPKEGTTVREGSPERDMPPQTPTGARHPRGGADGDAGVSVAVRRATLELFRQQTFTQENPDAR